MVMGYLSWPCLITVVSKPQQWAYDWICSWILTACEAMCLRESILSAQMLCLIVGTTLWLAGRSTSGTAERLARLLSMRCRQCLGSFTALTAEMPDLTSNIGVEHCLQVIVNDVRRRMYIRDPHVVDRTLHHFSCIIIPCHYYIRTSYATVSD